MSDLETSEYLPEIDGLAWAGDGYAFTASPSQAYWLLHRAGKAALRCIGLRVDQAGGSWRVVYEPCADAETVRSTIATLKTEADAAETARLALEAAATAARIAAMTPMEVELQRARKERWAREDAERAARAVRHEAAVGEVQASAKALIAHWGDFTPRRGLMEELAGQERMHDSDLRALQRMIIATQTKAADRHRRAVADAEQGGGTDWSDAAVERAVLFLTDSDADHASFENGAGWSKADSSSGHWCRAMLDTDRDLAIAAARRIVGKYEIQLKTAAVL